MNKKFRIITAAASTATLLAVGLGAAEATSGPSAPLKAQQLGAASSFNPAVTPAAYTAQSQSVYVPVNPCRIADTRSGAGPLVNNSIRSFVVRGSSGFSGQGGTSSGCGIPAYASGVTANVTITDTTGGGFMTGYPTGSAVPLSNFVTYAGSQTTTSTPTFTLAASGEPSLSIRNHGHTADVIIDVTGYYAPQMQALVSPSGTVYSGSTRVASVSHPSAGTHYVTFDQDVTACTPHASVYGGSWYASALTLSGNTVTVYTWYLDGTTHLPVYADAYFYVSVTC